jgi:hypothetical protein
MSIKDPSTRYIKQIKVRTGEFKYGGDHVYLCKIEKSGSFLGFTHIGFSTEDEQLKKVSSSEAAKIVKAHKAKRGRKSRREYRSELASAQIDLVNQMANDAFNMFGKK